MNDKEFTDEEIIKCLQYMRKNADEGYMAHLENGGEVDKNEEEYINILCGTLDLINRQKAEIERLKECPKCVYEYDGEVTEYCVQGPCSNFKTVEQVKSEAFKEFAEKLKEKSFKTIRNYGLTKDVVEVCDIDNLLKEMVGEEE